MKESGWNLKHRILEIKSSHFFDWGISDNGGNA